MAEAHQKNHDYHIIDPSPWPLLASIGAFLLTFGGVGYMRYLNGGSFEMFGLELANPWVFFIGLAIVLYVALHMMWQGHQDIVRDLGYTPAYNATMPDFLDIKPKAPAPAH